MLAYSKNPHMVMIILPKPILRLRLLHLVNLCCVQLRRIAPNRLENRMLIGWNNARKFLKPGNSLIFLNFHRCPVSKHRQTSQPTESQWLDPPRRGNPDRFPNPGGLNVGIFQQKTGHKMQGCLEFCEINFSKTVATSLDVETTSRNYVSKKSWLFSLKWAVSECV